MGKRGLEGWLRLARLWAARVLISPFCRAVPGHRRGWWREPRSEFLIRGAGAVVTMNGTRTEGAGGDVLARAGVIAGAGVCDHGRGGEGRAEGAIDLALICRAVVER